METTIPYLYTFDYDSAGRLSSFTFSNYPSIGTLLSRISYDEKGRATQFDLNYNYGIGSPQIRYIPSYDTNGNIETYTSFINYPNTTQFKKDGVMSLYYEPGRKTPIRITYVDGVSNFAEEFTYAGNNVVKLLYYNGSTPEPSVQTFTYDNAPNPLYGFGPIFGFSVDKLSENNQTGTYQLTYNANGLLARRYRAEPFYNEEFIYEAY
ncbi:hypothetical protein [Spirosoma oryzicola]|uniref:hypothetical protein n=1 Tax=Spirosoma oryzicola TaxID=2898794 RepID=UPI001E2E9F9F|nr:hypothetical protein [Spirosoma oryzicola]UHG92162.1 hypothetical protein LQ777_04465 [Spirosoma oryzicola]